MKWLEALDERDRRLVQNCTAYANGNPAGLPGHQLMLIINTMAQLLDNAEVFLGVLWEGEDENISTD